MKALSKMDLCEVAVVLQKANCKVTAVRFAELYASLYDKSIRILLGDNWWMELLRMPGIYVQLASADNGAALSEEATRPADVILWHYDAQFGLIRTKLLLG
ncbi:hypothetical protein EON65_13395 [archaeon]|nr:MAG: hypothetical protein EON65_13395 [archaeon]